MPLERSRLASGHLAECLGRVAGTLLSLVSILSPVSSRLLQIVGPFLCTSIVQANSAQA